MYQLYTSGFAEVYTSEETYFDKSRFHVFQKSVGLVRKSLTSRKGPVQIKRE